VFLLCVVFVPVNTGRLLFWIFGPNSCSLYAQFDALHLLFWQTDVNAQSLSRRWLLSTLTNFVGIQIKVRALFSSLPRLMLTIASLLTERHHNCAFRITSASCKHNWSSGLDFGLIFWGDHGSCIESVRVVSFKTV